MKVAGVSLENSLLRISIAEKKIGVIKPVKSEDVKLPLPADERQAAIVETLKSLKEKDHIDGIVLGVDIGSFSHHTIEMPALSRGDMRNALLFEMEKYLPLSPEEYIFDFFNIEKEQDKIRILALSIKEDRIGRLTDAIKESGIKLLDVRCSFIEAINEFVSASKARDCIFIYAAEESYHIAGFKGHIPVFFRTVLKGKDIVSEIERLGESFKGGIYVSGAPEPAVLGKITAKTFPLSIANAVAVSALKKQLLRLSFTPRASLPEKKDYYPYATAALMAVAVVLFFFVNFYPYYKDYSTLASVEKKIEQIKAKAAGLLDSRKKLESIYENTKFLYEFQNRRNLNIKVLAELSGIVPKDTWFTNLSVDEKGKIEMEGLSKRAAGLIEPLNKSKLFKKIEFASPIVPQNGVEKFSIRMWIQPDSGTASQ